MCMGGPSIPAPVIAPPPPPPPPPPPAPGTKTVSATAKQANPLMAAVKKPKISLRTDQYNSGSPDSVATGLNIPG